MSQSTTDQTTFSTTDTELAAWLLCNGIPLIKVTRNGNLPSVITFESRGQLIEHLSNQFYAWNGDAATARQMFKSYKQLLKEIKGSR